MGTSFVSLGNTTARSSDAIFLVEPSLRNEKFYARGRDTVFC